MGQPTSRSELKDYCLRNLGFPVIDINVDDDQLDDRIDDALQLFQQYHFDGTENLYIAQQATQQILNNDYVDLPDSIIGVNKVFPLIGSSVSSTARNGFNIFDINYQLRLNDFYNLMSSSYTYYVIAREHLAMLDMIITGEIPYDYNKKTNRLYLHTDLSGRISTDDFLCFQVQRIVDPDTYEKVFNDPWLKKYTSALFKKQWGSNLSKYSNYTLPGGLIVNGEKILISAEEELAKLELELREVYEAPPMMLVG